MNSPSTTADLALPVPEGYLRIGGPSAIPEVLGYFGVDPTETIASVGLDQNAFDEPDRPIEVACLGRLFCACVARTGCRHFGLLVGQQGGLRSLGLLGLLLRQSPDVGRALRNLALYLHIHDRGAVVTYAKRGEVFTIGYAIYAPGVACDEQITDASLAIGCNILRAFCGADWTPSQVLLARRRPSDVRPYQAFFRCPLHFDAEQNALVFASDWLHHRLEGASPVLKQILKAQVTEIAGRGGDFAADVRRALRALLVTGGCSADCVADLFSIHRRTLERRLEEQGTSFAVLLAEVRSEAAMQLLDNTDMPLIDIALTLGYSDATAFNRAFRHWSGSTPALWRAKRRQSGESR